MRATIRIDSSPYPDRRGVIRGSGANRQFLGEVVRIDGEWQYQIHRTENHKGDTRAELVAIARAIREIDRPTVPP